MTTSAQRGHFAFAVQSAKIGSGAYTPGSQTWYKHKTVGVDFAVVDAIDALPLEVGGGLFVSSTYKNGAWLQGSASFEVRLKEAIGPLIYGAAGDLTTIAAVPGTTPKINRFRVNPTDDTDLPWMSMRKYTPGNAGNDGLTEYGVDCRVAALRILVPQMGTLKMEAAFVGRKPIAMDTEDTTGTGNEDGESLALSCMGSVNLPGFASELPGNSALGGKFTGAEIILANQFTQPQQEMIIGAYHPDDFMVLSRSAMVRLIYKWEDKELYTKLYYGAPVSSQRPWTPIIQKSAVDIVSASAGDVATYTDPFQFKFTAPNVEWQMSPVTLAPAQMVQVELIGTVVQAAGGTPTWQIDLQNDAAYTF